VIPAKQHFVARDFEKPLRNIGQLTHNENSVVSSSAFA
jgi:hypothetical protein